jgi:hypothetical protein|tara:strand:- start:2474 stop:2737 length:264 start_codon:yes stop_codon:yes gene_type:complete
MMINKLSPADQKKVVGAIKELSDSMTRIDAEKDLIKDIVQVTFENHEIDKKHIRKLASIYHKANMDEVRTEFDDLESLYETLFSTGK